MAEEEKALFPTAVLWLTLVLSLLFVTLWFGGFRFGLIVEEESPVSRKDESSESMPGQQQLMQLGYDLEKDMPSIDADIEGVEVLAPAKKEPPKDDAYSKGPALL